MATSAPETVPAYKRIMGSIQQRIDSGELRPGDAVASERELAKIHNVSLMTARHALVGLEREGMVERRRGSGTFVAPPRIHFNKLMAYTEQMAGRSLSVRTKILSMKEIDDAPEIAAQLCLPPTQRLLRFERLRLAANEPFALETCYLAADEFSTLTREVLERGSLFSLLENQHGVALSHADEEVDATAANQRLAQTFQVAPGLPLLRIRQVIFSTQNRPVLYVLGLYRADRHTLHIRRFR